MAPASLRNSLGIAILLFCAQSIANTHDQKDEQAAKSSEVASKVATGNAKSQDSRKLDAPLTPAPKPAVQANSDARPVMADAKLNSDLHTQEEGWFGKVLTDPVASFTALLFFATVALWWATRRLVVGAEDTARHQLRAYLSIRLDDKLFLDEEGRLSAPLITKNHGTTPANAMLCNLNIGLFRFPLDTELDPPTYSETSSKSVLFPSEQVRQYPTLPAALNNSEIDAIKSGAGAIYVWGEVRYTDIFGKLRKTQFRMYSTGDDLERGELAYHHEGNTAD